MKYFRIIIPVALVLIATVFGFFKLKGNKAIIDEKAQQQEVVVAQIPVTTTLVSSEAIDNDLEMIGTFEARKELEVIAETQGTITRLLVSEGQSIKKGQSIATIDDATIQSQLATAKASLQKAEKDVQRYQRLVDAGAISQVQFEEVKLGMQNQQTNVTAIEQQLKYTTARSPMSGVIKEVLLEQGSFASPGTKIATVVDISQLNLIVKVDEKEVVKIKQGQRVQIITEVYPDEVFAGIIKQISVQADAARKFEVVIELSNTGKNPLKAGMYGTVKIPSSGAQVKTSALTIPRKSVVGSLKQAQVYVAKDGKAMLVDIEVGKTIDDKVIVLNGLKEGEEVITTGQINLDNGRAIKVVTDDDSVTNKNQ